MAKQEQIEQTNKIAQAMCGFCDENKHCVLRDNTPCSEVKCQDCGYKESAEMLICAGYGKVSEYKAEIERLRDDYAKLQEQFAQYQMASDKEIMAQKKQAKIDVLNEAKKCSCCDNFFPNGNWHRYVLVSDIDILIEEVEK